jgi:general secretion pathway protein G
MIPNFDRRRTNRRRRQAGFTMVELLVVLAIIGLIASIAVPQVLQYLERAREDTARVQIGNIESAFELYYIDNLGYPEAEYGISALAVAPPDAPRWNGPYLKNADKLTDPWGNAYAYELDEQNRQVIITSLGSDGKVGGEGSAKDISTVD